MEPHQKWLELRRTGLQHRQYANKQQGQKLVMAQQELKIQLTFLDQTRKEAKKFI